MVNIEVVLSDSVFQYLLAWSHLRKAEDMGAPEKVDADGPPPTTSAPDFMPPFVDRAIYDALAEAALNRRP